MGKNSEQLCADYSYGVYDDWFLPSKDELNLIYTNLNANGLGSFADFFDYHYWSSRESSDYTSDAWHRSFYSDSQHNGYRYYNLRVRAVRIS